MMKFHRIVLGGLLAAAASFQASAQVPLEQEWRVLGRAEGMVIQYDLRSMALNWTGRKIKVRVRYVEDYRKTMDAILAAAQFPEGYNPSYLDYWVHFHCVDVAFDRSEMIGFIQPPGDPVKPRPVVEAAMTKSNETAFRRSEDPRRRQNIKDSCQRLRSG